MAQQEPVRRYDTLSFDEALDVSDVMRERRTLRRISQVLAVLTVLLIGGVCCSARIRWPCSGSQAVNWLRKASR